jgi:hypothetical protein
MGYAWDKGYWTLWGLLLLTEDSRVSFEERGKTWSRDLREILAS